MFKNTEKLFDISFKFIILQNKHAKNKRKSDKSYNLDNLLESYLTDSKINLAMINLFNYSFLKDISKSHIKSLTFSKPICNL